MLVTLNILIFVCCLHIAFQDFKYKQISLLTLSLVLIALVLKNSILFSLSEVFYNSLYSILFLLVIFLLVTIYFSLKHKKLLNITNLYLGLGDIVLFLCLTSAFSFPTFILFFNMTLLLTLLISLFTFSIKKRNFEIPLAGAICSQYIVLFGLSFFSDSFNLYYGFNYFQVF